MIGFERRPAGHERRWPATLTVAAVLALQLLLPQEIAAGPPWLLPVLEGALLVPILVTNPVRLTRDEPWLRGVALVLVALIAATNALNLLLLVLQLAAGHAMTGRILVHAALHIWVTNVAAAALALWEIDRGGPFARDPASERRPERPDLLFPQMTGVPGWDAKSWRPGFSDYLFTAFTAATAFSPTDVMPLSPRAKLIIGIASGISLLTIALVAARAVNIL